MVGVIDIGDAAGHPGPEVPPRLAQHDDPAAGHVLTAVVPDALDHSQGAGVTHTEPLAHDAPDEHLATGGPVQDHVAGDDVVLRDELRVAVLRRAHDQPASRQALADVVVGVTFQP